MEKGGSRSLRDCVVWAVIIGGHALLIIIFSGSSKRHIPVTSAELPSPGVLVLLDLPPLPPEQSASTSPQVTPAPAPAPTISRSIPPPELPAESTAITLPPEKEAPVNGAVDWQLEAERSARNTIDSAVKPRPRGIGEQPVSPFREKKKPHEFEWDPEPKKGGLAGGFIPYVRIGKRCVVGLGFWGCTLGKLPEANGHLFDHMSDPDRPRSSVPDYDGSSVLEHPE